MTTPITMKQTRDFYTLLLDNGRSLGDITADFVSRFPKDFYTPCSALVTLLEDNMLTPTQRLISLAILHQAFSYKQKFSHPFMHFLLDMACDEGSEYIERAFIHMLLGTSPNSNKELMKQSIEDYTKGFEPSSHSLLLRENLEKQFCDVGKQESYLSVFRKAAVKNVIPDPELNLPPNVGSGDNEDLVISMLQKKKTSFEVLEPQCIRPVPPLLPVLPQELKWINPDNTHDLLWDYGMCADTSRGSAVRELISKALKGPLLPAEQEFVRESFPNLGFSPQQSFIFLNSAAMEDVTVDRSVVANSDASKIVFIKHLKTVTLDRSNYFAWRAQFVVILRGHELLDFVHGRIDLSDAMARKQNQLIQEWLLSAMSAPMLAYVTTCSTSAEVWNVLLIEFASSSRSRLLILRQKIQSVKKGSRSVSDYIVEINFLVEALAIAGEKIEDLDLVRSWRGI